ncbi:MAG: His/Gly/Thr/Pro-type tRNA ligase C-terminal domain-containing protein, partial [Cyanobacteria bacterium P01_H01_bin.130]
KDDNIAPQFLRLVDPTAAELKRFATGQNKVDFHAVGANWGDQYPLPDAVDLREAQAGDRAIHNPDQTLETARGIEAGHIFQLGLKYSQSMEAKFMDVNGKPQPLWMGCYGIGVSRIAQAAVEQCHDDRGIVWPKEIAPYHVIITVPNVKADDQMEVATKLYEELTAAGIETLLDDRPERAGVKFKDAELIGIPYRVVTGRSIADGEVELVSRATGEATNVAIDAVVEQLKSALADV